MKRVIAAGAALAIVAPLVARAHTNPARRSIAVQAEPHAAVLLVEWTVPSGEYGYAYGAMALWGRKGPEARRALESELAAKAIGPLEVTLDGKKVAPAVETKLTEDPPRSGRIAVAVLLTVPVADGAHELRASIAQDAETTVGVALDHSEGRAHTDWPEKGDVVLPSRPIVVDWR